MRRQCIPCIVQTRNMEQESIRVDSDFWVVISDYTDDQWMNLSRIQKTADVAEPKCLFSLP